MKMASIVCFFFLLLCVIDSLIDFLGAVKVSCWPIWLRCLSCTSKVLVGVCPEEYCLLASHWAFNRWQRKEEFFSWNCLWGDKKKSYLKKKKCKPEKMKWKRITYCSVNSQFNKLLISWFSELYNNDIGLYRFLHCGFLSFPAYSPIHISSWTSAVPHRRCYYCPWPWLSSLEAAILCVVWGQWKDQFTVL